MLGTSILVPSIHPLRARLWQQAKTSVDHHKRKIGPGVIIARGQATPRKHVGSFMENLQKPGSSKARKAEAT